MYLGLIKEIEKANDKLIDIIEGKLNEIVLLAPSYVNCDFKTMEEEEIDELQCEELINPITLYGNSGSGKDVIGIFTIFVDTDDTYGETGSDIIVYYDYEDKKYKYTGTDWNDGGDTSRKKVGRLIASKGAPIIKDVLIELDEIIKKMKKDEKLIK